MNSILLSGIKIVAHPLVPKVQAVKTDPNFIWCSDEARRKHDAWLLERFGMRDQALFIAGQLYVTPGVMGQLKKVIEESKGGLVWRPEDMIEEAICRNS
jgi:hypothetical protein